MTQPTGLITEEESNRIPPKLRELPAWLVRREKIPHYVSGEKRNGTQGAPDDRAQLATYEKAVAALHNGGRYSGLGLAMLPDWELVCIDLDHCLDAEGHANALAREIMAAAGDTYVERSPSGRGLHVWLRGNFPDRKNVPGGVEVFCGKGYLTMTGDALEGVSGAEIKPLKPEMSALLKRKLEPLRNNSPLHQGRAVPDSVEPNAAPLERIASALKYLDAGDRDLWLKVIWAVGRETNQSAAGYDLVLAWAVSSSEHDPQHDPQHMRAEYFERSAEPRENPVTLGTVFALARASGWRDVKQADADHYRLALAMVEELTVASEGERPVFALGDLYCVNEGIWCKRNLDGLAMLVAERFAGGKYCKRGNEFKSVATIVAQIVADEKFFDSAPIGIAAPGGFWHVTDAGEIQCEPLNPAHRQRMRTIADPDPNAQPRLVLAMLAAAFEGHEPEQQITLVQQLVGLAITRTLWRHMIAVMLLGVSKSGKSTLLSLLASVFPREQVGATSPQRWDNEYYAAALADIALNIVGELDQKAPIPGGAFKNIVGRDLIQGRHPTHRPFTFICQAAHFFNSNHTPPITDHSDAFFNRWRIVHFANTVPPEARIRDLDKRLIAEETGAFLWWALEGAAAVAKVGSIAETETNTKRLKKWRVENNSALSFLFDECECELDADCTTPAQKVYDRYKAWAVKAGFRAFGRTGFYDALAAGAGEAGVTLITRDNQLHVDGVALADVSSSASAF